MAGHRRQKDSLQRIGEPDGHPPSDVFRLIDTQRDSPNGHYVNGAANAAMKATGGSSNGVRSSCAELFSGTPVAILHMPADCTELLNVALAAAISDAGLRRSESAARPSGATTHEFERQGRWKQGGGMVGRYTCGGVRRVGTAVPIVNLCICT